MLRHDVPSQSPNLNACFLKSRRTVYRNRNEDYYDKVRVNRGPFSYEKALHKRKVWVKPLFAETED